MQLSLTKKTGQKNCPDIVYLYLETWVLVELHKELSARVSHIAQFGEWPNAENDPIIISGVAENLALRPASAATAAPFQKSIERSMYRVALSTGDEYPYPQALIDAINTYGDAMRRVGKATIAGQRTQEAVAHEAWRHLMAQLGATCREIATAYS